MMTRELSTTNQGKLLWGFPAIAMHINRTVRQTYYLAAKNKIPIKKLGKRTVCAFSNELDRALATGDVQLRPRG